MQLHRVVEQLEEAVLERRVGEGDGASSSGTVGPGTPSGATLGGGGEGSAGGEIFLAIVAAVALATILAVVAGLVISASGAMAHDLVRSGRLSLRSLLGVILATAAVVVGAWERDIDKEQVHRVLEGEIKVSLDETKPEVEPERQSIFYPWTKINWMYHPVK